MSRRSDLVLIAHAHATHCTREPHAHAVHRSGVLAELASRGYPALALDLRGHGESPFGPPDDFGAETLARDVWDAVAAHGVRGPVVLVGHSMGGRVAMRAATLPEASRTERHHGAPPPLALALALA